MSRLSFSDAMEIVPDDLPDGAYWAMAHELAGLEYGDGFDFLADSEAKPDEGKRFSCGKCGKKFQTKAAKRQHRRDAHELSS